MWLCLACLFVWSYLYNLRRLCVVRMYSGTVNRNIRPNRYCSNWSLLKKGDVCTQTTFFRHVYKLVESDHDLHQVCLSVHSHGTILLPLDRFS